LVKACYYVTLFVSFIQVQQSNLPAADCVEIYRGFQACLDTDQATFARECSKWKTWWTDPALANDRPEAPASLSESVRLANEILYPNVRRCLAILLVMPVSTATAERSFSTMRRVKTYLRSTMGTERMSGLGLMNIYRDMQISSENIVDKFAEKKRRLAFVFKV
jgi:hypothetical protein